MQSRSTATTHEEYIELAPENRRQDLRRLHDLIRQTAPELEPTMEFGMLGYGKYHYRYATGREGEWMLVGVASNKSYISLYVTAVSGGQYLAEKYADRLGKASVGKSCIRFRRFDELDHTALVALLEEAALNGPGLA